MHYFYTIQCQDKISDKIGNFVYCEDKPFEAISPVFENIGEVFRWMRKNDFVVDYYEGNEYFPSRIKKKQKFHQCSVCGGAGEIHEYDIIACPGCDGEGGFLE